MMATTRTEQRGKEWENQEISSSSFSRQQLASKPSYPDISNVVVSPGVPLACLFEGRERLEYVLELLLATALNKDVPVLCAQFSAIIDKVEAKYRCKILYFTTDADGGSLKGRNLLAMLRPCLLVPSCWAHQFQLILGDYFKAYPYASQTGESATALIGWINNHCKVSQDL
jgi:hypothetical protein